jgi:uncharacterized protein DUF4326
MPKSTKSSKAKKVRIESKSETTIVNVKVDHLRPEYSNLIEWLQDDSHVYIGRDMSFYVDGAFKSKWHNPFKTKKPGKVYKKGNYYSLDESVKLYEEHIRNSPELMNSLEELRGKTLGCWCKPRKCHGDILVKLVNEQNK